MQRRSTATTLRGVRAAAGLTGAVLLFTTACSGGGGGGGGNGVTVGGEGDAAAPQLTISPGDGNGKAKPEEGVVVKSANGTLEQVTVTAKGKPVEGQLSSDKTTWQSRTLVPNATYEVSALAKNPKGKTSTATSKFKTIKAKQSLGISDITPSAGEKVGIGMPVQITFDRPVTDKKAVEKALVIKSDKPATGAWKWMSSTTVIFRTENGKYWEPNQKVTVTAKLAGVKAAKNTYGTEDFTRKFKIGDSHVITVNTKTHRLTVKKNGKKVNGWGISAGRGGMMRGGVDVYLTTSGIHLVMAKSRVERMTSAWMGVDPKDKKAGGYDEDIPFAVRISNSGEYIHSMASTTWAQGRQNVSHGCLNSPPAKAEWFFNWAYRGDVVTVVGTKRKLDYDNGWSYYQLPWKQWVKGSALDQTVTTA